MVLGHLSKGGRRRFGSRREPAQAITPRLKREKWNALESPLDTRGLRAR
jgi:hypothetical protein